MNIKLKTCSGCGEQKPIWKNHEGEKYCKYCWQKHNPKNKKIFIHHTANDKIEESPLVSSRVVILDFSKEKKKSKPKQKSKKREAEDQVYTQLRKVFLTKNPSCEARLKDCSLKATDVHHTFWGADRGKTYLEVNTWKAVCRGCHDQIHGKLSAEESKALGLKNSYRDGSK
jgi:hypothetical protein